MLINTKNLKSPLLGPYLRKHKTNCFWSSSNLDQHFRLLFREKSLPNLVRFTFLCYRGDRRTNRHCFLWISYLCISKQLSPYESFLCSCYKFAINKSNSKTANTTINFMTSRKLNQISDTSPRLQTLTNKKWLLQN